jgi:predicted lipid-binding transport protein (Tim44 family)
MPKTSRAHRKKRTTPTVVKKPQQTGTTTTATIQQPSPAAPTSRARPTTATQGTQGLLMSGMVALGCWGLAAYYAFIMNDSNHFLFGGFAAVLALLWSFSFGLRVRRWQQKR